MTGAYVRIQRGEEWHALEIEHLTDEEREKFFRADNKFQMLDWINMLCRTIKLVEEAADG